MGWIILLVAIVIFAFISKLVLRLRSDALYGQPVTVVLTKAELEALIDMRALADAARAIAKQPGGLGSLSGVGLAASLRAAKNQQEGRLRAQFPELEEASDNPVPVTRSAMEWGFFIHSIKGILDQLIAEGHAPIEATVAELKIMEALPVKVQRDIRNA
jgi:hypothetical protein